MKYLLFVLILLVFSACSQKESHLFIPSEQKVHYKQSSFSEYVLQSRQHIKDNRVFLTKNTELEVRLNSPYELIPKNNKSSKGILLVHGLGDSPAYFNDIAHALQEKGFLVRVVLLPGHGTRPADLIDIEFEQWKDFIAHHVKLLEKKVNTVYLGGFSTGTNLVTSYAIEHQKSIDGLLLFSPGFAAESEVLLSITGLARHFKTWLDVDEDSQNIIKYEPLSTNAAFLYYQSLQEIKEKFKTKTFTKPVFIAISEDDSVIDAYETLSIFSKTFVHKNSRLLWFGKQKEFEDNRVMRLPSYIPEKNIGNMSHLSVLFSENSYLYGKNSTYKMVENGQGKVYDPMHHELWYSAWGLSKKGKYFVRLTWNPYFKKTLNLMFLVLQTPNQTKQKL